MSLDDEVREVNQEIDRLLTDLKKAIEERAKLLGTSPASQAHAYLDSYITTFEETTRVM